MTMKLQLIVVETGERWRRALLRMVLDPKVHNEYGTILHTQEYLPHQLAANNTTTTTTTKTTKEVLLPQTTVTITTTNNNNNNNDGDGDHDDGDHPAEGHHHTILLTSDTTASTSTPAAAKRKLSVGGGASDEIIVIENEKHYNSKVKEHDRRGGADGDGEGEEESLFINNINNNELILTRTITMPNDLHQRQPLIPPAADVEVRAGGAGGAASSTSVTQSIYQYCLPKKSTTSTSRQPYLNNNNNNYNNQRRNKKKRQQHGSAGGGASYYYQHDDNESHHLTTCSSSSLYYNNHRYSHRGDGDDDEGDAAGDGGGLHNKYQYQQKIMLNGVVVGTTSGSGAGGSGGGGTVKNLSGVNEYFDSLSDAGNMSVGDDDDDDNILAAGTGGSKSYCHPHCQLYQPSAHHHRHNLDDVSIDSSVIKIDMPSPMREEPRFPKEKWKTLVAAFIMFLNFLLTTCMLALVHERVPDRSVYGPLPDVFLDLVPARDWALDVSEILIMILLNSALLILLFHKHRFILFRRLFLILALLYLMRSITMYVTVLPVSSKTYYCSPKLSRSYANGTTIETTTTTWVMVERVLQLLSGFGLSINGKHTYCGDYIYSGHTVILVLSYLFIAEYSPKRFTPFHWIAFALAFIGVLMVLIAHGHYTVDILIAYYVTTRLFWLYHTLCNNPFLKNYATNNFIAKEWWFPCFQYFEKNVGGVVPRQYNWPFPWPKKCVSKHPNRDS